MKFAFTLTYYFIEFIYPRLLIFELVCLTSPSEGMFNYLCLLAVKSTSVSNQITYVRGILNAIVEACDLYSPAEHWNYSKDACISQVKVWMLQFWSQQLPPNTGAWTPEWLQHPPFHQSAPAPTQYLLSAPTIFINIG